MSGTNETDLDEGRARRIETRLTRLMLALGIDPGQQYNRADQVITVNLKRREVALPSLNVSLLDCANAITSKDGDLQAGWTLVLRDRIIGTLSFPE